MTYRFRSTVTDPHARGTEFGAAHRSEITATVTAYQRLFDAAGSQPVDLSLWGTKAFDVITEFAPRLADEIAGIAAGADLPVTSIASLNARTEILAALGVHAKECSTVVRLRDGLPPVSVQAWDWYSTLADLWLVWEIPHADGGHTTTVTEYGIVGKIGVNGRGLGIHFNILHHDQDGQDGTKIGLPVHVLARDILDHAGDLNQAMLRAAAAPVSASTSLTMVAAVAGTESTAVSVELNPGGVGYALPDAGGLLVHTNHFLSSPANLHDTELRRGPDTVIRHDMLRRALAGRDIDTADALDALSSHLMGGGATCCHVDPTLPGHGQFQTLATVALDVADGTLTAHPGGACTAATTFRRRPMPKLKRIDNMDILSRDVDRLVRFYHDVLGLPFHLPYEKDEEWAAINLGNVTLYIFKSEVGEHAPRRTAVNLDNAPGYDSIAFEVDDLDETEAELDGHVEWVDDRIEWKHPNGTWYRYRPFFDPDGNMLYITEPHISETVS